MALIKVGRASPAELIKKYGMDAKEIAAAVRRVIRKKK